MQPGFMDFLVIDHKKVPRATLITTTPQINPKNKLKLDKKVQENVNGKTDNYSVPGGIQTPKSHTIFDSLEKG